VPINSHLENGGDHQLSANSTATRFLLLFSVIFCYPLFNHKYINLHPKFTVDYIRDVQAPFLPM